MNKLGWEFWALFVAFIINSGLGVLGIELERNKNEQLQKENAELKAEVGKPQEYTPNGLRIGDFVQTTDEYTKTVGKPRKVGTLLDFNDNFVCGIRDNRKPHRIHQLYWGWLELYPKWRWWVREYGYNGKPHFKEIWGDSFPASEGWIPDTLYWDSKTRSYKSKP